MTQQATNGEIDKMLTDVLAGTIVVWPDTEDFADQLRSRARFHGVSSALFGYSLPDRVSDMLRQDARQTATWELQHAMLLQTLLLNLPPHLILKGTALAYDLYPEPAHRMRGDTDIWVSPQNLNTARTVLADLGFELVEQSTGQDAWQKTGHVVDLHWRVMAQHRGRDAFTFDDCYARSVPLPALSENSRRMSNVDALCFALLHRARHLTSVYFLDDHAHEGADRLIWLLDIALLSQTLREEEWARLMIWAKELGAVQTVSLGPRASMAVGGNCPSEFRDTDGGAKSSGALDGQLQAPSFRHKASVEIETLRSIKGAGARLAHVRDRLWPDRQTLERRFPQHRDQGTAVLRLKRLLRAVWSR